VTTPFRSARDAEAYLLGFINYELTTRDRATTRTHDLRRFARLLHELGWDPGAVPTVHIGGTNAKGTVAWLLERVLRRGGVRTGLYTSPHLLSIRERIRVDGCPISPAAFRDTVGTIAERYAGRPQAGFRTTFEHLTALAFLVFQEAGVERAVVEVGLGGRLDATNVIAPGPALLTPISRDHTRILGTTVRTIAGDKAHILKRGGSAFLMRQTPAARAAVEERLRGIGIPCTATGDRVRAELVTWGEEGTRWEIAGRTTAYGRISTRLLGRHQGENLEAVVAVAESLLPPDRVRSAVRGGLSRAVVPGRLQVIRHGGRTWILDGGHNPGAGRAVARALALHYPGRRVTGIIGMARDKEHGGYLAALAPVLDRCIFTRSGNPRAAEPPALARRFRGRSSVRSTLAEALAAAGDADIVLVAGSYVLAGEALPLLGRRRV
jgi:dihydrofolate synthase/folylpolyglutamate synthase